MKRARFARIFVHAPPALSAALLGMGAIAAAQDDHPKGSVQDGYTIHQTIGVGGDLASIFGNEGGWDTMVNPHTGPRMLNQTLDIGSLEGSKHFWFDTLFNFHGNVYTLGMHYKF